jgi:hypothetical protein
MASDFGESLSIIFGCDVPMTKYCRTTSWSFLIYILIICSKVFVIIIQ